MWVFGLLLFVFLFMVVIGFGLFVVLGKDLLCGFEMFFYELIKSLCVFVEFLFKVMLLLFVGLGFLICFCLNVWNIGVEG